MAAKIKDGLFIGDAETSQSEVFINDNKISNLINLAGREVHNVWASHGLVYLTYYWEDRPDYKLFTSHEDALLTDIVEFIDVSISHGISVLLFSRNGTGRCVVAACLYLMMKYRWGFEKTYDYVYSKKPDIDLNKGFIQQMFALDMKLLAARQKANAIRYGMENHFKIEANMTINDISAMLSPLEAKRWNAWDPDYVLESAEAGSGMDGESKGEGGSGRYKDSKGEFKRGDARRSPGSAGGRPGNSSSVALSGPGTGEDDELILIYSFLNSKNTITTLPGPYLDVYETHKNFKLKFNPICFEEDVNWFPSAGVNAARGALKGARAKHAAMLSSAQPKAYSAASSSAAENKRTAEAKFSEAHSSNGAYTPTPKSVVALENIAPMYIINSQRESRDRGLAEGHNGSHSNSSGTGAHGSRDNAGTSAQHYYSHPTMTSAPGDNHYSNDQDSPPTSAQPSPTHTSSNNTTGGMSRQGSNLSVASNSSQQAPYSSDLYEFVGISTEQGVKSKSSREGPQRSWGPRDSIAVQRDHIGGGGGSSASSRAGPEDYKEDIQEEQRRQARGNPPPYSASSNPNSRAAGPGATSGTQQLSAEDRLRNLMADMQRHKPSTSSGAQQSAGPSSHHSRSSDRDRPDSRSEPAGPSLYELATMQIGPNGRQPSGGYERERDSYDGRHSQQGQAQDYIEDVEDEELSDPLSAFQRQQGQQQYSGSRGPSSSGGAVRARHDIITHSGRPGSTPTTAGPGSRSNTGAPVAGPRSAWASGTGPIAGPGGSRGTSPSSSRPASPSPGAAGPGSRSASPAGKKLVGGAGGTGSVSSNLSVNSINSNGSNQVVGSGTTSGSRVYRYNRFNFHRPSAV